MSDLEKIELEIGFTKESISKMEKCLEVWNSQIDRLKKRQAELDWKYSKDERWFGGLSIEANHTTWKRTKELDSLEPFFVKVDENSSYEMTIEDAKGLIKYLQQKIEYLEEK